MTDLITNLVCSVILAGGMAVTTHIPVEQALWLFLGMSVLLYKPGGAA